MQYTKNVFFVLCALTMAVFIASAYADNRQLKDESIYGIGENHVPLVDKYMQENAIEVEPEGEALGRIYGYVKDNEGKPVEKARVIAKNKTTGVKKKVYTDVNGLFELDNLEPASYRVSTKKGYENAKEMVTLCGGNEEHIEFELNSTSKKRPIVMAEEQGEELPGKIYGYVHDIDEDPIEDVKVIVKSISGAKKKKVYTDSDGLFEFEDMEPDTYKLTQRKKCYKKAKETIFLESGGEEYVEIELRMTHCGPCDDD